ncbi:MAG: DUF2993 domain-containing protein, partial [Mycobacterium sp.]
ATTTAFAPDQPADPAAQATDSPQPHALPQEVPATNPPPAQGRFNLKRILRDPLSIVLIGVILLALTAAGLIGGEVYARHIGSTVVSQATACVIQDKVNVSFGAQPFLLQVAQKKYDDITVTSAGNNVGIAKGMTAQIVMKDVELKPSSNSTGTMGSLEATLNWPSDGIKDTIASAIPLVGGFVNGVTTDPSAGTLELEAGLASVVVKPTVIDGAVSLQVLQLGGLGFMLPHETIQPALDAFAAQVSKNYPMGIKADSLQVTDKGIVAKFSTQNATMPPASQNSCFAGLPNS